MIKFGYTIVYVDDVERTLQFFERAFSMSRRFITEEKDYGELDTGATTLAFAALELADDNLSDGYIKLTDLDKPIAMELALVATDVESAFHNAIKHGARELKSPTAKPGGQIVAYVRCPSGILIELCTPISK